MGMYVCNGCFEKHGLTMAFGVPHFNTCECCKAPHEWVNFTWDITRFGPPIAEQLLELKAKRELVQKIHDAGGTVLAEPLLDKTGEINPKCAEKLLEWLEL